MPVRPLVLVLALLAPPGAAQESRPASSSENVVAFEHRSALLSAFWGREIRMQAAVVVPPDRKPDERLPVCYSIHGFGGSHQSAFRTGPALVAKMRSGYPRMLYVFLNAQCPLGHHVFADSVNNGPWGQALVTELIPALEKEHKAGCSPAARFLTGHSSGGWSSLWLQISWPDFFGGVWSTSPDSVDFRDFTGIDVYRFPNAYQDPEGKPIPLMRRGGAWAMTIEEFVGREIARKEYGGQFASFDAVFSPRGEDGRPLPLFDRKTGVIDPFVAKSWEKYDMTLVLRRGWATLGPALRGKLHVFMGTLDTFRLEGALRLFRDELKELGSDATIVFAEGRDHGTVMQPHPEWPDGLLPRIHKEMRARFDAGR